MAFSLKNVISIDSRSRGEKGSNRRRRREAALMCRLKNVIMRQRRWHKVVISLSSVTVGTVWEHFLGGMSRLADGSQHPEMNWRFPILNSKCLELSLKHHCLRLVCRGFFLHLLGFAYPAFGSLFNINTFSHSNFTLDFRRFPV